MMVFLALSGGFLVAPDVVKTHSFRGIFAFPGRFLLSSGQVACISGDGVFAFSGASGDRSAMGRLKMGESARHNRPNRKRISPMLPGTLRPCSKGVSAGSFGHNGKRRKAGARMRVSLPALFYAKRMRCAYKGRWPSIELCLCAAIK